jgi:hypothetical protein
VSHSRYPISDNHNPGWSKAWISLTSLELPAFYTTSGWVNLLAGRPAKEQILIRPGLNATSWAKLIVYTGVTLVYQITGKLHRVYIGGHRDQSEFVLLSQTAGVAAMTILMQGFLSCFDEGFLSCLAFTRL